MNVLMYPIAPEDDFPDEFCAIRQGSGEHWFYTPAGDDASWMLFRAESENAKLRELAKGLSWCSEERYLGHQEIECPLYDERTDGKCRAEALMKELGIEVGDG